MAYPAAHGYLTILGDAFTQTEEWQTGFHLTGTTPPTPAQFNSINAALENWLDTPQLRFPSFARYVGLKWAPIGTDGKYLPGAEASEFFRSSPFPGQNSTGGYPQIALVTSLRTDRPRGVGSNGRNYWPSAAEINFGGGFISNDDALAIAAAAADLIGVINDAGLGEVVVASQVGSGLLQPVTGVRIGRIMDTQRRRRNQLPEIYTGVVPVPT